MLRNGIERNDVLIDEQLQKKKKKYIDRERQLGQLIVQILKVEIRYI